MDVCNVGQYGCASLILFQEARTTPAALVFWIPPWPICWCRDDDGAEGPNTVRHGLEEECRGGWIAQCERRGIYERYEVEMGDVSMECGHGQALEVDLNMTR